jgi:hypothetical protein
VGSVRLAAIFLQIIYRESGAELAREDEGKMTDGEAA